MDSIVARIVTTSAEGRHIVSEGSFKHEQNREFGLIRVYPSLRYQKLIGFGGAVTETVAELYWQLSEQQRQRFLEEHFSPERSNYRLVRVPIQSCDFGRGTNSYVKHLLPSPKAAFDLSHDERQIIPLLQEVARFNPQVEFLATPWSPAAFMKTNHTMRFGGHLKPRHEDRWAYVIARFVAELRGRGIPVTRLTVQNEPRAAQVWESCQMDAEQEVRLARKIRAQLKKQGVDNVKILAWDHNKERLIDRISESRQHWGEEGSPFDGWAFHWYTGDHFQALDAAKRKWRLGELIMTEGCEGFSTDPAHRLAHAEHYAHDILGDLNAGANAWLDWNMMLDETGGPTYVRNFCSAPAQSSGQGFELLDSAAYIRHFSGFIEPGAVRLLASSFDSRLEATAWENPNGQQACVVLNRTDDDINFALSCGNEVLDLVAKRHSIQTVCWSQAQAQAQAQAHAEGPVAKTLRLITGRA